MEKLQLQRIKKGSAAHQLSLDILVFSNNNGATSPDFQALNTIVFLQIRCVTGPGVFSQQQGHGKARRSANLPYQDGAAVGLFQRLAATPTRCHF